MGDGVDGRNEALAMYIRAHLVGASGGIRLAQLLADDPWMSGRLDTLPGELADEVEFAKLWASENSRLYEGWTYPVFGLTAAAGGALRVLKPLRGSVRRAVALESMRSLILAKKAMWELGLAIYPTGSDTADRLAGYDRQAVAQAARLQDLHGAAVREAFGTR